MFSQMVDICSQMVLRWDRLGPDNEILTSDDFTICFQDPKGAAESKLTKCAQISIRHDWLMCFQLPFQRILYR